MNVLSLCQLSASGVGRGHKPKNPNPSPGDDRVDKFVPGSNDDLDIPWLCKNPGSGHGLKPKNPPRFPGGGDPRKQSSVGGHQVS